MDKKTTSRLENIMNLKQKIVRLHNQLAALENIQKKEISKSPIKYTPIKQTHHNESFQQKNYRSQLKQINHVNYLNRQAFKNPTFWGENPIIGDQSGQAKLDNKTNLKKKQVPAQVFHKIMLNTADKFYRSNQSSVQSIKQTPLNSDKKQGRNDKVSNQKNSLYNSNKNQSHYNSIEKINKSKTKIKTFHQKQTNPILQPPEQRYHTKKLYTNKENSFSNKNIYTDHNRSNQLLYFLPSSKPIYLSSKLTEIRHRKNDSSSFRNLLSNSLEKSKQRDSSNQSRNGKKHFSRHFHDMSKNIFDSQRSIG